MVAVALLFGSIVTLPTTTYAAVSDTDIENQLIVTQGEIVDVLEEYIILLQLQIIQRLEIHVDFLKTKIEALS